MSILSEKNKYDDIDTIIHKFQTNLEVLFDSLGDHVQILNKKGKTKLTRTTIRLGFMTINNQDSIEKIMHNLANSSKNWHKIDNRDADFFKDHLHEIIENMPNSSSEYLADVISVDTEDFNKDIVFKYFDAFIKLTVKYVMFKRVIVSSEFDGDSYTIVYENNDYMKHIDPTEEIKIRKIKSVPVM